MLCICETVCRLPFGNQGEQSTWTRYTASDRYTTVHGRVDLQQIPKSIHSTPDHVSITIKLAHITDLTFRHEGKTLRDVGTGLAQQGILQVKSYKTSSAGRGPHYGTPEEPVCTIRTAMKSIDVTAESPSLLRHAQPVLDHPDFHPGNIFVSEEDPTAIVNIIDWQFTSIMPRFTLVQWPLFLAPPEGYRTGMSNPELLPEYEDGQDYDGDHDHERKQAEALMTKCYEAPLQKTHLESYLALTEIDIAIRHLFTSCSATYREGIVPLRDSLIRIFQNWSELGLEGICPYHFTKEEILRHANQIEEYRRALRLREYTHQLLHTNDGGWVPPQVDFEGAPAKHEKCIVIFCEPRRVACQRKKPRNSGSSGSEGDLGSASSGMVQKGNHKA